MKQPVERRLAAILAADVTGYSRLMGADEEGTLERLKAHRRQLVDPKITEHRGRIVKTTGDGMLVEFGSVVDAVRCAVEMQRAMVDRNAEIPEDKRITFRIGVNLGDIIVDGDDIYGDGVNIAARLEALAEPGGICISRVVRDQIRDKLPYEFADLGEQSVKNIARPLRTYAMSPTTVAATPLVAPVRSSPARRSLSPQPAVMVVSTVAVIVIGIAVWWAWPNRNLPTASGQAPVATSLQNVSTVASTPAPRLSIVVLPFANLSNDPEQEYFADGIIDDLTTDLSRISDSFVIAHNTALTYKGRPVDVKQVGRELSVRYVLEGSVRRAGDQVQVNAQLVDAETGAHLWADRFDTNRRNLPDAQNEITGRLARTLHLELGEAVGRRIEQEKVVDPNARDFAMRGWALFYRPFSVANRREAQRAFEQALEIDPRSVDARIGIALVLATNVGDGWSSSIEEDKSRAEQLLLEALERDANRSMAHYAMAMLRRVQNRLAESQIEFETAIALDRNNARAFYQLGNTLLYIGLPEAGIPHIEKAIRLNPYDPNRANFYASLGMCHLVLGHVDEAIDLLRKARAENPRFWFIHFWLAGALGLQGDLDEARAALAESLKLKPAMSSLARRRNDVPWIANPPYWALQEKTLNVGLRRAGFPEE
jgi:TolB-like protein/class 3 adenylate cyclase/Flp pilus assembly protein TadD